ncbi:hypothetical protein PVK06_017479 [Gossypium arboreum]|uniref:Uncharacterized protein n=1 Tax=Gossypium arboreum TaxID=29729 RepID=A0ABR0Q3J8_GOSAR|nr:hypothetical protein PVK06_017479 [Gossypium arboreum]
MNMHIPSLFAVEALGCLQAVTLGLDLGFRDEKAGFFRRCSFTLLLRTGNIISYLLAREGLRGSSTTYLHERVLDFMLLAVESDRRTLGYEKIGVATGFLLFSGVSGAFFAAN